ncbi:hypothetical protein CW735_10760 [Alteromonas sp. MB-3u-76]|uniref:MHYT domain-containing protein n=1 Tax=Alteromonas sp. MB-3u-76 TaxID=2058133 RepID=UPI000C30A791|nr:hypothetical protein CW735_10760 [Alteromonas sp. MB-3u-76]
MSFFNIFAFDNDASLLESSYHFPLILLSLLIAVFASFMAFNVASVNLHPKGATHLRRNGAT